MMLNTIYNMDVNKVIDNRRPQKQEKPPVMSVHEHRVLEDRVSLQENQTEALTYSISKKAELMDSDYRSLREMLANILEEQGIIIKIAFEDTSINFRDLTQEEAQELVLEEGYYGVEQTSDRIVQFALSVSGHDPDKLEEIKSSIDKGFQMAKDALGGSLPEISMKTYDAVMEKLDAWAEGFNK